ncbi:MAG: hypothetical protein LBR11_01575 [Deltaproteobacteria bacterium]|nr:hypothetical protein [Deltaproteobacteria bacterium]
MLFSDNLAPGQSGPQAKSDQYYRSLEPFLDRPTLASGPDWPTIFGRQAPLELEIGFGNGEYLNRASLAAPERDFLGLEIAWASIKRALRRLANPPRPNVRLIMLPAHPALELLLPARSLHGIRALFPVPWPRASHDDKRLFSTEFLNLVADRLTDEGFFQLVTDNEILADWVLTEAAGSDLALTLTRKPALLDTKYERKWQNQGQDTFFHLEGRPYRRRPPLTNGLQDMRPILIDRLDPLSYRPQGQTGPVTVVFGDFIFDPRHQEGLLLTKVVEGRFVQEFFIRLARQPEGSWKVFPAIFGQALPTAGVRLALSLAAGESPPSHD